MNKPVMSATHRGISDVSIQPEALELPIFRKDRSFTDVFLNIECRLLR
jgi:hypothetical protein